MTSMVSDTLKFALFPVTGLTPKEKGEWDIGAEEIAFSGQVQASCVCFVDIVDSTKISDRLSPADLSRYYEIFLNGIAAIAKKFGARIVKNVGDALIFYFEVGDNSDTAAYRNVLDCGIGMGNAAGELNARMMGETLPPISYRISADYGQVAVAKSQSSQREDLFGPAMNICAKINRLARPNGLVIGERLYEIVRALEGFDFTAAGESLFGKTSYPSFHVVAK